MATHATIVEVAKLSGTSLSTVSRVINNSDYPVNEETRKRVLEAAEKLGYRPNNAARTLRMKKSMYIAAIVPSLNNPFYSSLVSAIELEVLASGYLLQLYSSNNDTELENRLLDLIGSVQAAALLISSVNWTDDFERKVNALGIPVVLFDQIPRGYTGHFVRFDFYGAGRMAAEYLLSMGHRNILLGSGEFDRESRRLYRDGFLAVLDEAGIDRKDAVISVEGSSISGFELGIAIAENMLSRHSLPTAVAVINDITALGVMKRLELAGLNVPADVSLIGFDDIQYSSMISPGLTTIRQPAEETGRKAAKLAISLVSDPEKSYENEIFHPVLIKRESVRKIGKHERSFCHD